MYLLSYNINLHPFCLLDFSNSNTIYYTIHIHSASEGAEVVVFVSKMIAIRLADLSKRDILLLKSNRKAARMRDRAGMIMLYYVMLCHIILSDILLYHKILDHIVILQCRI